MNITELERKLALTQAITVVESYGYGDNRNGYTAPDEDGDEFEDAVRYLLHRGRAYQHGARVYIQRGES